MYNLSIDEITKDRISRVNKLLYGIYKELPIIAATIAFYQVAMVHTNSPLVLAPIKVHIKPSVHIAQQVESIYYDDILLAQIYDKEIYHYFFDLDYVEPFDPSKLILEKKYLDNWSNFIFVRDQLKTYNVNLTYSPRQ